MLILIFGLDMNLTTVILIVIIILDGMNAQNNRVEVLNLGGMKVWH